MPDDDELITRVLEGSLEGAEAAAAAERIDSDPAFRARVAEQLLVARTLPLALTDPGQSAASTAERVGGLLHHLRPSRRVVSVERVRRRLRRQRHRRLWILTGAVLAAAACLVLSWLVLVPPSPPAPQDPVLAEIISGPQVGRQLRAGDEVQAGGAVALQLLGDTGARIELQPGTLLRWEMQDGSPALRMPAGGLACIAAPRDHQRPLLFIAGPWVYRVVGTRFTLQRHNDLSGLDVSEGVIAVGQAEGEPMMVRGGQAHRADDRGRAELRSDEHALMMEDFDLESGRFTWRSSGNTGTQVTQRLIATDDRPGRSLEVAGECRRERFQVTYAQAHGELKQGVLSQAMSAGLAVRVHSGSGGRLRLCVLEGTDPAHAETHEFEVADDQLGWRDLVVPWTAFRHARQYQMPGAPSDGLDPTKVRVVAVQVHPPVGKEVTVPVRFSMDDLRLLSQMGPSRR